MEEIITVDGRQFKLSTDRPLTAHEKAQTIAEIRKQTGCSTCGPRVANMGDDWQYGGIRSLAPTCVTGTKASGEVVTLSASPSGAVGPYYVRFWRKPNAAGAMAYGELGSARTVSEGSSTSTNFTLYDTDLVAASGDTTAGTPTTGATGAITDPYGAGAAIATGKIRVATTTYDSCPTGAQSCVEYCDINLACVAPTCNFVVT
jgi:hypothetical protein